MYPVGSVYVNSTNTNPSTMFGGEWQLIDKKFIPLITKENTFTPSSNLSDYEVYMSRSGNSVRIRLFLTPLVELGDTSVELATLNFSTMGIKTTYFSVIGCMASGDGANGATSIDINANTGAVTSVDVLTKESNGTIAAKNNVYCDFTVPIHMSHMLDSAVSEFHFKRVS